MKNSGWATWLAVYAGVSVTGMLSGTALRHGAPDGAVMAGTVVIGLGLGWFWYWRYPRPLAERLFGITWVVLLLLTAAAFDFEPEKIGPNLVLVGVLAGLVLAEVRYTARPEGLRGWRKQRATALTSRQTMSDLR